MSMYSVGSGWKDKKSESEVARREWGGLFLPAFSSLHSRLERACSQATVTEADPILACHAVSSKDA